MSVHKGAQALKAALQQGLSDTEWNEYESLRSHRRASESWQRVLSRRGMLRPGADEEYAEQHRQNAARLRELEISGLLSRLVVGELTAKGREASPIAPLRDVPASAWHVIEIRNIEAGEVGIGDTIIYDIQISASQSMAVEQFVAASPPNAAKGKLHRFLKDYVSDIPARDSRLTQGAILAAAQDEFPSYRVTREAVREWIKKEMPDRKRFPRGDRPRDRRAG